MGHGLIAAILSFKVYQRRPWMHKKCESVFVTYGCRIANGNVCRIYLPSTYGQTGQLVLTLHIALYMDMCARLHEVDGHVSIAYWMHWTIMSRHHHPSPPPKASPKLFFNTHLMENQPPSNITSLYNANPTLMAKIHLFCVAVSVVISHLGCTSCMLMQIYHIPQGNVTPTILVSFSNKADRHSKHVSWKSVK